MLPPDEMPVGGHTETFMLLEVSLEVVKEAIDETIRNRKNDHRPVMVEQFDSSGFFDWVEAEYVSST